MITRRAFAGVLAGFAVAAPRSYALETLSLKNRAGLDGWIAARSGGAMAFQAIAARHMPQIMVATPDAEGADESLSIPAPGFRLLASSPMFELRRYEWGRSLTCQSPAPKESCFVRAGISPIFTTTPGVVLIPFDSLAAREKAWATLAADPEWTRLRSAVTVNEISIYSPIS